METRGVIINERDPIKRSSWTRQFLKEGWIENLENNATVLVKISAHILEQKQLTFPLL